MITRAGFEAANRGAILSFSFGLLASGIKLAKLAFFKRKDWEGLSFEIAEFYSNLCDLPERSISHEGFTLPTALGDESVHRVNRLLLKLYGGKFASLSMGGTSSALITLLIAVLPKLHPSRDLILFDDVCHQSAIGGLIFGRWKAVRIPRIVEPSTKTAQPLTYEQVRIKIEAYGAERIAAILIVTPSYDGFSSPSENRKIYELARSLGITVVIDGAWDSTRFRRIDLAVAPLESICDIWISSPHKRGLTPSSLGCMITQDENIARLWDDALDLGFRSSSASFVDIMIAEHRLQQIVNGDWDEPFSDAEKGAKLLREFIQDIHPKLNVLGPRDAHAETADPAHLVISTHLLPNFDAREWARTLSSQFNLDVEKSTDSTILLLCASPAHLHQLDKIKAALKQAFEITLNQSRHYVS